jgi:hypothetical protein
LFDPSQRISTSWPTSASCIGSALNIAAEGFPLDLASFAEVGTLIDVRKPKWICLRKIGEKLPTNLAGKRLGVKDGEPLFSDLLPTLFDQRKVTPSSTIQPRGSPCS